jgi:hypothetical protein
MQGWLGWFQLGIFKVGLNNSAGGVASQAETQLANSGRLPADSGEAE